MRLCFFVTVEPHRGIGHKKVVVSVRRTLLAFLVWSEPTMGLTIGGRPFLKSWPWNASIELRHDMTLKYPSKAIDVASAAVA